MLIRPQKLDLVPSDYAAKIDAAVAVKSGTFCIFKNALCSHQCKGLTFINIVEQCLHKLRYMQQNKFTLISSNFYVHFRTKYRKQPLRIRGRV